MTIHIDTVEAFERELDKRLNGLRVKLANGSTIALSKYLLAQIRDARRGRMRAEEALREMKALFDHPSLFYIRKSGGLMTNGDQAKIDAAFISLDAALERQTNAETTQD